MKRSESLMLASVVVFAFLFRIANAIQHVDVSFESPVKIVYSVNELGSGTNVIVYDKLVEDGETFYGVTQKYGTNRLWISETESYKGGRSLAASCYAVNTYFKDRAEFRSVQLGKDYALQFGQEMYYGYAMKIDSNSTPPTAGMHIMQAYQNSCGSQIPITLSFHGVTTNGVWRFLVHARTLTSTRQIGVLNLELGRWYKCIWKFRPAYPGLGSGEVSLWIDDQQVVSWQGNFGHEPTSEDDEDLDLRCGIYRGSSATHQTVFYDQIKYGDSYYEADPDMDIDWGFHSGTGGWTVRKDIQNLVGTNDCLDGTLSGSDCGLLSPDNLGLDCSSISNITVKMKNSTAGTTASFFFTTTSDTVFTSSKQLTANIIANDSDYTVYQFGTGINSLWTGTLKQLRFDPVNSVSSGSFSIDFIDLNNGAFNDDFNRSNTSYSVDGSSIGSDWVNSNTSDTWKISNNKLYLNAGSSSAILYNNGLRIPETNAEFILSADVSANIANGWAGLVFNCQNSSNYYVLRVKAGSSSYQIIKVVNGTTALVMVNKTDAAVTFSPGTLYSLLVQSDAAGSFNFAITEAGSSTLVNPTVMATDTGTVLVGGYAGLYSPTASAADPDAIFDDYYFEVGP